ncbi:MAG: uroporphyrinogen-III C-methyltransferase [Bacillota bacterium]
MGAGIVYLVGAGPGDPGLFTLKGREVLEKADVVVYDRLVNPALLSLARSGAEVIYAGKSPAGHTLSQEEINSLLVERAKKGAAVVRLKGGDPFVFGRGGEEAEALAENGVPFEVVPGVTSAVAAPAYAGIPVTHRDFTSTVAIVTGNEDPAKENSRIVWEKIATGAGTLVFLMGMANLEAIASRLLAHGRAPGTPVALIRWGTWAEQQVLTGTLAGIARQAEEAGFANPAVIVVGEVAGLRDKLRWVENRPLFGKRVLVTRAAVQAGALSGALRSLGAETLEFPTIKIAPPGDYASLDGAIARIEHYDWLIFTSVNGVQFFFERLVQIGRDIRDLKGVRIGAIGPATRRALAARGLKVAFMPGEYRAEAIVAGLAEKVQPGQRILLPRADIARPFLREALAKAIGAAVEEVAAYRTVMDGRGRELVREYLEQGRVHVVTFTSSSTVRYFADLLGEKDLPRLLAGAGVACIGPVTAQTAEELGLKVDVVAAEYTIEGLVEAILERFGDERCSA